MASRLISDLSPLIIQKCLNFQFKCKNSDIDHVISCTYRSNEEQLKEYQKGRKLILGKWIQVGRVSTKAPPGQSAHNVTKDGKPWSLAFDVMLFKNGKPLESAEHPDWRLAIQWGKDCGLENLYPFESCHFQLPGWRDYIPK
jgi:hypothetical protein